MRAIERVLMTTDTAGGVFSYSIELARALSARGITVDLATLGGPLSSGHLDEAATVSTLRIHESSYRLEWMTEPWEDVAKSGRWLLDLEATLRPDVVHLNGYAHGALPFHAPKIVVAHSCVLSWHRAVFGEDAPATWDRYRTAVARGVLATDALVAPSRAMLRSIQHHYGLPARARIIPNARDPMRFRPMRKDHAIVTVGRLWDRGKNIAELEAIAPRLPWPVRVAGSCLAPDGSRTDMPGLDWLGHLSSAAVASTLARTAIFALPALYEPFGLAVLEAALSGCALVLGDIPSLRELWNGAALFADPRDPADLERTILCLVENSRMREMLGVHARARGLEYAPDRMASAYLALYREVASSPSRRGGEDERCAS